MAIDYDQAIAELPILREFIEFLNRQTGVYMDCLAGFSGNKVRIERAVARNAFPTSRRVENGIPVTSFSSLEDPNRSKTIHFRIFRSDEYAADNSQAGYNEQQICWSIITFIFAHWDEEVRPHIALVRRIHPNDIKIEEFGDLRILRKAVIHNRGIISSSEYKKMRKLQNICEPDKPLRLTHDQMHVLFVSMKQAIAGILMEYAGRFPGAPDLSDIVGIAIQTKRSNDK